MLAGMFGAHPVAAAPAASWQTVASFAPNAVNDGWSGYTFRQRVSAAALAGATRLRVTLRCASGKSLNVAKLYIGNTSGDFAFSGAPTQVLFGGSTGLSVSGAVDAVSDTITFAPSGTSIVLASYFNAATSLVCNFGTSGLGGNGYYKAGDDAITEAATGYTLFATDSLFVRVEKYA